ncbi:MAG TPA: hypothetical protein VMA73_19130 [Streptosporangiaceae bacterium]|nr:hypothetical protein [Streptosporangiaceae bacterium]
MSWLWPNLALAVIFFGCWAGIPLWMVLRHPTWGPMSAHGHGTRAAAAVPEFVAQKVAFDEEIEDDGISEYALDETIVAQR